MATSTLASQLRIAQRTTDTGWISPTLVLEALSSDGQSWVDVSDDFQVVGSVMQITGSVVACTVVLRRITGSLGVQGIYRLSFPGGEGALLTPQRVGQFSIRAQDSASGNYVWAIYDVVSIGDGYFQVVDYARLRWPDQSSADVLQFDGTWFTEIEE